MAKKKTHASQADKNPPELSISPGEWTVMELMWQKQPRTSQELTTELGKIKGWKRPTVITLLRRLVAKGALTTEAQGNKFLYRTGLERQSCVQLETESFLNRLFGGALQPLVAHFAEHHHLTQKDIGELRELLDKAKPKN